MGGWVGRAGGYTVIIGIVSVQIGLNLSGLELSLAKSSLCLSSCPIIIVDGRVKIKRIRTLENNKRNSGWGINYIYI